MKTVKFETDRLLVREFELDDAGDCFAIYSQPQVIEFLKREPVTDLAQMRSILEPVVEQWKGQPFGTWAIQHRETRRVIGSSILKPLPDDDRVEVGWHLHPDYWGQGLASESGKGALDYGFRNQGLSEIFAIVLPTNLRSRRVTQRIGMTFLESTNRYHELELDLFRIKSEEFALCS